MTTIQLKAALTLAQSEKDLSAYPGAEALCGFGVDPGPFMVPLATVARCIRWQCCCFDGSFDMAQFQEDRPHYLRNVEVSDWLTARECSEIAREAAERLVKGPEYYSEVNA